MLSFKISIEQTPGISIGVFIGLCLIFTKNCLGLDDVSGFTPEQHEIVRKAVAKFIKWRNENGIDNILNVDMFDWKDYPYHLEGYDKDGRPVVIGKVGEWDIRKTELLSKNRGYNLTMYAIQSIESMFDKVLEIQASGKKISSGILIIDMRGYNLVQHGCARCIAFYIDLATYFETYYRGFIKHLYVINIPRSFAPIIRLVWPIIQSKYSKRIIEFYGPKREEWQKALLKQIPADQLSPEYGGTKLRSRPRNLRTME